MRRIIQRSCSITSSEKSLTRFIAATILVLGCGMLCPALALAQQLTVGTATGAAGTAVNLTVSFTAGASAVSTLQFDLQLPSALSFVSVATGSAATATGKSASGSLITGGVRVVIFGLNQSAIGSGPVAIVSLNIAGGTAPDTLAVGITNITASDPTGTINVPTTGTGGSVTVSVPSDTTPPSIPTGLTATAVSSSQINLSWTASTDNVGVTGYKIFRNGTQIATSNATSFQNTGLPASTTFRYTVSSFDAAGNNSAMSAAASATTQAGTGTPPLAISSVAAASVTSNSATIDWTTNSPSSSQVEYGATTDYGSSTPMDTSPVTAHSETLNNLTPNTLYHYRVHSQDSSGNQAVSEDFTFTTTTETGASQTCSTGIGLCFEATLPSTGGMSRVSSGQGDLSVMYGVVNSSAVSLPVALANFGLTQNGVLVTEVGVPASAPFNSTRLFVDSGAPGADSGVAVVNPNDMPIMMNAELRDQLGEFVASTGVTVEARGHTAQFVSQLIANMPNPFLGTLTLSSTSQFAAVNLRLASNAHGETLFSALPLADLDRAFGATRLIFPQVVDGGGLPTQILLMNPSVNTTSTGFISFFDDDGNALTLDFGPATGFQSSLNYSLGPNGMVKYSTTGLGALRVGYAVVTPLSGFAPVGSGIFSINGNAGLVSQAGVPNAVETMISRMFVERSTDPLPRDTGVAMVNRNGVEAQVTLTLVSVDGSTQLGMLTVPPNGHVAKFVTELFPGLPAQFQGVLTMISPVPVAAMTLRQTANQRGDLIYSTLPVADLTRPLLGPMFIPQIADGGGYQTQLILINTSNSLGTVEIDFFNDHGVGVSSPLK